MEFSEITLNSKYLFDKYLKKHDPQISELTFTNFSPGGIITDSDMQS